MKKTKSLWQYLYIIIPLISWGSTAAIGKILLKSWNGVQIYFLSALVGAIVLFLIVIFTHRSKLAKEYIVKEYRWMVFLGLLLFLWYVFIYYAIYFSSAQEAFIINYLWPILMVVFASFILKEKFTSKDFISLIISFFGVYIIATKGNIFHFQINNIRGILCALGAAITMGLFSVLGKRKGYDSVTSTMLYFVFGLFYAFIILIILNDFPNLTFNKLGYVLWLGIFPYGLAFVSWFLALKTFNTARVANLIYLTPFVSLIYIYYLAGEKILLSSVFGLIFIILGIVIQLYGLK